MTTVLGSFTLRRLPQMRPSLNLGLLFLSKSQAWTVSSQVAKVTLDQAPIWEQMAAQTLTMFHWGFCFWKKSLISSARAAGSSLGLFLIPLMWSTLDWFFLVYSQISELQYLLNWGSFLSSSLMKVRIFSYSFLVWSKGMLSAAVALLAISLPSLMLLTQKKTRAQRSDFLSFLDWGMAILLTSTEPPKSGLMILQTSFSRFSSLKYLASFSCISFSERPWVFSLIIILERFSEMTVLVILIFSLRMAVRSRVFLTQRASSSEPQQMKANPLLSLNLVTGCLRPKMGLMLKWCWIMAVVTLFSKPDTKIPLANSFFFSSCSLARAWLIMLLLWGFIPKGAPPKAGGMPPIGILIMGLGLGKVSMLFVVVETIISQQDYCAISIAH